MALLPWIDDLVRAQTLHQRAAGPCEVGATIGCDAS
jgi:hypothetical protein